METLTKSILYTLGQLANNTVEFTFNIYRFRSAYATGGRDKAMAIKRALDEKVIKRALRDLARRQFIKIKRTEKKLIIAVNDKGRLAILRDYIRQTAPSQGLCTVVIFDIPEKASSARSYFRRWLKNCDFKMLQRSVWIINRDVADLVNQALEKLRLPGWIITLTTVTPSIYKNYRRL